MKYWGGETPKFNAFVATDWKFWNLPSKKSNPREWPAPLDKQLESKHTLNASSKRHYFFWVFHRRQALFLARDTRRGRKKPPWLAGWPDSLT